MARFAQINENNIVTQIIIIDNINAPDPRPENSESLGKLFIKNILNLSGEWLQTSYNTLGGVHYDPETKLPSEDQSKSFRKNYAGIGYFYDSSLDAFIPPRPYESWVLDEESCLWNSPIPYPDDGNIYFWNEENQSWDLIA